jgi:hypothetical protein
MFAVIYMQSPVSRLGNVRYQIIIRFSFRSNVTKNSRLLYPVAATPCLSHTRVEIHQETLMLRTDF